MDSPYQNGVPSIEIERYFMYNEIWNMFEVWVGTELLRNIDKYGRIKYRLINKGSLLYIK